jgi:hypothetical protein
VHNLRADVALMQLIVNSGADFLMRLTIAGLRVARINSALPIQNGSVVVGWSVLNMHGSAH